MTRAWTTKSGSILAVNWPLDSSVAERQLVWDNHFKSAHDACYFYVFCKGCTSHPRLCYTHYKSRGFNCKPGQEVKLTSPHSYWSWVSTLWKISAKGISNGVEVMLIVVRDYKVRYRWLWFI